MNGLLNQVKLALQLGFDAAGAVGQAPSVPTGLVTSTGIRNVINTQWDDQAGCTFNVYVDGVLNQTGVVWQVLFHKVNIGASNTVAFISLSAVNTTSGLESAQCDPVMGTSGS